MAARAPSDGADTSASIGQLVASIKEDLSILVRDEVQLAKAELRQDVKAASVGGALAAVGVGLLVLALIIGSFALVYGIHALGLTLGWSFLVVTGFYLLVAAVCLAVALGRFKKLSKAQRTKITAGEAAAALRPSHSDRT